MSVLLPWIGITINCERSKNLLENYHQNIVGSFWIMCKNGFETKDVPSSWDYSKARDIIENSGRGHNSPLYLGFCILAIASKDNPLDLSFVIEHIRMEGSEGITLLELMDKNDISAFTTHEYPEDFLRYRYGEDNSTYNHLRKSLENWSVQVWEDYCGHLMAGDSGRKMLANYLKKDC